LYFLHNTKEPNQLNISHLEIFYTEFRTITILLRLCAGISGKVSGYL
jgi:hypothetical protein